MQPLAFRNSVVVRNHPDFNPDINHLITAIGKRAKGGSSRRTPMIIGAVAVLAIIAALLSFVVLPGMNASQGIFQIRRPQYSSRGIDYHRSYN